MCRPGTNGHFSLVFFLPLFLIGSCGNAQVLNISQKEAHEFLGNGDINFIRAAELPGDFNKAASVLKQLLLIHPAAPFYAGLLAGEDTGEDLKTLLFCAALESPSLSVNREAILKLIPLVMGKEADAKNVLAFMDTAKIKTQARALRAACLYRLGQYNETVKLLSANQEGDWEKTIKLFAEWKSSAAKDETTRLEIPGALFSPLPEEILIWAYGEALSTPGLLNPSELAALAAKLLVGDYRSMLNNLREALEDGGIVFFRYPELLPDLGRAYQYTPAMREEGANLFKTWDGLLENGTIPGDAASATAGVEYSGLESFIKTLNPETINDRRFRVLFYSGRIKRAMGQYSESSEYFRRACNLAPDAIQADSCTWYMLMNTFEESPLKAASLALETMSQWNDVSYFDDILDRLSCYLTGRRKWPELLDLFFALERHDSGGTSLARYAWILGRAAEEGYIKTENRAEDFFRIAFEGGKGSFYYRAMAASKLGAAFIPGTQADSGKIQKPGKEKDEMEFLLGFFECGGAMFALPYIRAREEKLSIPELEKITEALAAAGRWKESLDLVSRYTGRKDYELSSRDLFLLYPQPYKELIEKHARETELSPEILYGLIRTESYFMSGVVSRSGATGLSQLMAPTADEMADRILRRGGPDYRGNDGINLKDPEVNIHIGSYYLKYLTEQMGSPMLALLAYNGGMGRIRRALAADKRQGSGGLPLDLFLETIEINETREYGRRVLAAAAVYGYLYYGN